MNFKIDNSVKEPQVVFVEEDGKDKDDQGNAVHTYVRNSNPLLLSGVIGACHPVHIQVFQVTINSKDEDKGYSGGSVAGVAGLVIMLL